MQILQFIPAASVRVMLRIVGAVPDGAVAVLDLEDGNLDVREPLRTQQRKLQARELLFELCKQAARLPARRRVGVRLNCVGTDDFRGDIPVVRAMAATFGVATVVLPKIVAAEELAQAHDALAREGIAYGGLTPLVETHAGMARVAEIVAAAAELGAPAVGFGYHDYCLDVACWPFPRPQERRYWEFAARVAEPALAAGLRYIHPPDPALRDETLLGELLARLQNLCGPQFDVFSAGMSQTAVFRRLTAAGAAAPPPLSPLRDPPPLDVAAKRRLAEETCAAFARHRRDEHSYAADARQGRFISPHELLAAKRYLRSTRDA